MRWLTPRIVEGVTGFVWRDRRTGNAVAIGLVAAVAVAAGWWTPRGPVTTAQALVTLAVSAVVGAAAGLATRSRWAMLLAPIVFVAVFELVRIGSDGPTVDAIRPDSTYGFVALVVGRGFHGAVALAPMVLGAAFGAALARRLDGEAVVRHGRSRLAYVLRRAVAGAAGLGLVALAVAIARPATTDPVRVDGRTVPGSVAELIRVDIGGHDLAMMIRGASSDLPVLLFLAGGPGGSELGAMRRHLAALEEDFVVVTWDQRGTGKSYTEIEPTETLTFDGAVADTIEVTEYLRDRFGQDRIYLVGQSYGTVLGVRALQQAPELYAAYVGVGQMVDPHETDRIFYDDTLAWARAEGNDALVAELTAIGPPPYRDLLDLQPTVVHAPDVYPYDHRPNSEGAAGFSENLFVPEYSLVEQVHLLGAMLDTFAVVYPQLRDVDLRVDATQLEVPVYLAQGAHEAGGRAVLADEWFAMLDAPHKEMTIFDTSGHRPMFEQPDEFHEFMTETVLGDAA